MIKVWDLGDKFYIYSIFLSKLFAFQKEFACIIFIIRKVK